MVNFTNFPIDSYLDSYQALVDAIKYLHIECNELCFEAFGRYLYNPGNVAIFCQNAEEFEGLTKIRKEITVNTNNPDQKYFKLIYPVKFEQISNIPKTTYEYLYIRKPRDDSPERGDIDFSLEEVEFNKYKNLLLNGGKLKNTHIYDREDLDMIEIKDDNINAITYVSTIEMAKRARIKQSDETIL